MTGEKRRDYLGCWLVLGLVFGVGAILAAMLTVIIFIDQWAQQ